MPVPRNDEQHRWEARDDLEVKIFDALLDYLAYLEQPAMADKPDLLKLNWISTRLVSKESATARHERRVALLGGLESAAAVALRSVVIDARGAGCSWSRLAKALGRSRQGVSKRFRGDEMVEEVDPSE